MDELLQLNVLFLLISSYFMGSIPFGLVLTKVAGLQDIRKIGSGNIGATNVLRTGNKLIALLTLLLDAGKAACMVWIAHLGQLDHLAPLAGAIAVLGHNFPVWLKFKGGKGVASSMAVLLALQPVLGLSVIGIWLAVFLVTRISSLAALLAWFSAPITSFLFYDIKLTYLSLFLFILIAVRHKENILRLVKGKESRF